MVTFDCSASRHDGVTLVAVRLADIDVPTRVRIENGLDGPVWPPRREGVPEAGWTDDGFEGVLDPPTAALGYASPAPPADPVATLVDADPVPGGEAAGSLTDDPDAVVRHLGDPSPPADAVPGPRSADEQRDAGPTPTDRGEPPISADAGASATATPATDAPEPATETEVADLPPAVDSWLAEMARRVDHAEALAAAESLPEATAAVREAGGLAGVRDLADDERQLRAVAERARRLADRRAAATVPVETLATLA